MFINRAETVVEFRSALQDYLQALDDADQIRLEQIFWDSETTVRFGAKETLIGKSEIRKFRTKRGPREPMRYERIIVTVFGEDAATANILFSRGSQPGVVGRWSQFWARIDGTWRITSAHVSLV